MEQIPNRISAFKWIGSKSIQGKINTCNKKTYDIRDSFFDCSSILSFHDMPLLAGDFMACEHWLALFGRTKSEYGGTKKKTSKNEDARQLLTPRVLACVPN
jgi:hypothetical protein